MSNNDSLKHLSVTIELGRKNPVAEKAVRELEEELIRQEPGGRPLSEVGLAIATTRLNSRLQFSGLSSRELLTQRNQFTHEQFFFNQFLFKYALFKKTNLTYNRHFLHSYIFYDMNLLTKLLLLTHTTIPVTLILFTLLTPLNILKITLLTKLKNITYNTNITIKLQHEVLRGAKNSTLNTTSLLHRFQICNCVA